MSAAAAGSVITAASRTDGRADSVTTTAVASWCSTATARSTQSVYCSLSVPLLHQVQGAPAPAPALDVREFRPNTQCPSTPSVEI